MMPVYIKIRDIVYFGFLESFDRIPSLKWFRGNISYICRPASPDKIPQTLIGEI